MSKNYKQNRPKYYSGVKTRKKRRYFLLLFLIPVLVIGTLLIIRSSKRYEIIQKSPSENAVLEIPPTPAVLSDAEGYSEEAFVTRPTAFAYSDPKILGFKTFIMNAGEEVTSFDRESLVRFKDKNDYTSLTGITTFKGNHYRSTAASGSAKVESGHMQIAWTKKLPEFPLSGPTDGTAQPLIVRWPADIMDTMTFKTAKKGKVQLTEVIFADKSGFVYYIDLDDGEISRTPMPTISFTEGTPTLDPRGYPLLYIGQSIQQNGNVYKSRYNFLYVFNLITQKEIFRFGSSSVEPFSDSKWQGYGASPLIYDDTLMIPGENGILYTYKIDAEFDIEKKEVSVNKNPELVKYKYENRITEYQEDFQKESEKKEARVIQNGTTGSLVGFKNYVFFSDKSGFVQCIDINKMQLIYAVDIKGNGEFTLSIEEDKIDDNRLYLYSGTRLDFLEQRDQGEAIVEHQDDAKDAYFRKIDGLTGQILWENVYKCKQDENFRGGISSACIVGKNDLSDYVIYSVVMADESHATKVICANKQNGETVWTKEILAQSKTTPVAIYDKEGKGYILFCDANGHVSLIDGATGEVINRIVLEAGVDGSPVVYGDNLVVHLQNNSLVCIKIN
jgi:outer membrane protein assembly factor BamB